MRISRFQFQSLADIIFRLCQTILFRTSNGTVRKFLVSLGNTGDTPIIYTRKERIDFFIFNLFKDYVSRKGIICFIT